MVSMRPSVFLHDMTAAGDSSVDPLVDCYFDSKVDQDV